MSDITVIWVFVCDTCLKTKLTTFISYLGSDPVIELPQGWVALEDGSSHILCRECVGVVE